MVLQALIVLTGLCAVWLSQDANAERRRYACLFGITAQPLWMISTFQEGQWGMFALCFVYLYAWGRGVSANWLNPRFDKDS